MSATESNTTRGPSRGIIQSITHGPGPMTALTVLTSTGDVESVPCATAGLPPAGVEIVYWRGHGGALLGWSRAEVWDTRNQFRNRYEPEQQAVVMHDPEQHGCGNCGGNDLTLLDDSDRLCGGGDPMRPFCRVCQGWAD